VLAIAIALTNLAFVLFIVPESLLPSHRLSHVPSPVDPQSQQQPSVVRRVVKVMRNVASQFLRPAALFIPHKLESRRVRDWNLTLTGVALFLYVFADVSTLRVYVAWVDISFSKRITSNTFTSSTCTIGALSRFVVFSLF
jgi:hypothetical protein